MEENVIALLEAAKTASNYIHFIGGNYTAKGQQHPQQLLLDKLDLAISNIEKDL